MSFERYKLAKEAKKVVQKARVKVYKEVCKKLDTKEVEKDIYKIARIRERLETYVLAQWPSTLVLMMINTHVVMFTNILVFLSFRSLTGY